MKGKDQIRNQNKRKLRVFPLIAKMCLITFIVLFSAGIVVSSDVRRGAASGAAIGGFLGLVFGGDLGDVVGAAAIGAGAGAVGGAVSESSKKKEAEKRAQQQREQEQKQKQQQQAAIAKDQKIQDLSEQELIRAIGEDNYRGLLALVSCEHKRADALANAGAAAKNPNHRLSSLWLKALIANDLKQKERTAKLYKQIVIADTDIDTEQQASIETDKVLMDVRQERRDKGISCRR